MSSDWYSTSLGEICKFTAGSAFKTEHQGLKTGKYPFIKVSDMNLPGNEIVINRAQNYVSDYQKDVMAAKLHPAGATVFAKIGVALQSNRRRLLSRPTIIDNNMMSATPKSGIVTSRFLYFLLCTLDFNTISAGSALPYLNISDLQKISVSLPQKIEFQEEIEKMLSVIDDRIILLRETNLTLDAIAQALFKSWFIDFEPVLAKQAGRQPEGIDVETAALFPDEFERSELGLIPKDWSIGTLEDLLVLQRGFDLPASERHDGPAPIIAASGPSGYHAEARAKAPGVVTGRSGVLGLVFLVLEDYWPLNTSLWVKEFKRASPCYAFQLLKTLQLQSFNAGSAVPTLNRNHINGTKQLLPSSECIAAYEDIAMPLHRRAKCNENHAKELEAIRDTLLPRLISGQLRLSEAEEQINDALTAACSA